MLLKAYKIIKVKKMYSTVHALIECALNVKYGYLINQNVERILQHQIFGHYI